MICRSTNGRARMRTGVLVLWLALLGLPLSAGPAVAHPLGNFTINTAATVVVGPVGVTIEYAIDMAEVPTLQADADADGDGRLADEELSAFAASRCQTVGDLLEVGVNQRPTSISVDRGTARVATGSADLPTLRVDCVLDVQREADDSSLVADVTIDDQYGAAQIGWHEIVIVGDAMTVVSGGALTSSPSDHLGNYPDVDPLDVTTATAALTSGGPLYRSAVPRPAINSFVPGVDTIADRLIGDGGRQLTGWSAAGLLATATLLGALHAFAPGHGKTVMAAYLLGEQGRSVRQALVLGATVTATHTVGVLALGTLITLTTLASPNSLYPWLGAASGLLVACIGANLLRLAVRSRKTGGLVHLGHVHGPGGHTHGDGAHHDLHDHRSHHHHHAMGDPVHHPDLARVAAVEPLLDLRDQEALLPAAASTHTHHRSEASRKANQATITLEHEHEHDHDHDHDHDGRPWRSTTPEADSDEPRPMKLGSVVAMGFAGGMVPSPSALVVLLGAIALGRTVFGIGLVAAYGLGMACTLIGAGLIFVVLRDRSARLLTSDPGSRIRRLLRYGPLVTAVAVVGGGLLIAARALAQL